MDLTAPLVRLGSLVVTLLGVVALWTLLSTVVYGVEGVSTVGVLATLLLLTAGVVAAAAWGRRTARVDRETPYW